jgi:hypothetical protein
MKQNRAPETEKVLEVWVQPRASRNQILGFQDKYLRIRLTAPPHGGEANRLLREILAKALGISIYGVEILSGHKSRRKRIRVMGAPPGSLEDLEKLQRSGS